MTGFVQLPGTGEKVETLLQDDATKRQVMAIGEMSAMLELLMQAVANLALAIDPSNSRLRATLEGNPGVNIAQFAGQTPTTGSGTTAAGTLRTVNATDSPLNLIGGIQASPLVLDMMATTYGQLIRPRIT
jgi:hypothetical protein